MYYYYYCALQNFNNVSEMYDWRNENPEEKKSYLSPLHTEKKTVYFFTLQSNFYAVLLRLKL